MTCKISCLYMLSAGKKKKKIYMSSKIPVSLAQTVAQLQSRFLFKALLSLQGAAPLPPSFLDKGGLELLLKNCCL